MPNTGKRLNRDHPEIWDRYEAGEFPSVRQAAIAAGIVTPDTPLTRLLCDWAKADAITRAEFLGTIRSNP